MAKGKNNKGGRGGKSNPALDEWQKQWEAAQAQEAEVQKLRDAHSADILAAVPDTRKDGLASLNKLGVRLFKAHCKKGKGNTALFPSSIHPVYAMLRAGAKGETGSQIDKAFGFKKSKKFESGYAELLSAMRGNKDFTLDIFNRAWNRPGFNILAAYKKVLKAYETDISDLDFSDANNAAKVINDWADVATRHLISQIVTPDVFTDDTVLVLGNAVFYKGKWIKPFDKQYTHPSNFTPDGEKTVQAQTMTLSKEPVRSFRIGSFTGIDLPMKGASMLLLLPDSGVTLDSAISKLGDGALEKIDEELRNAKPAALDIYLPKFKIETPAYDLVGPSSDCGVTNLFTSGADLSGIAKADLYVSAMLHKAVIEVDEEGSTGAAVTVAVVGATSWRPPTEIRFNRSFLAIVRDRSKAPVAFARVHNPNAG